jgi:hypothetical protein
MARFKIVNGISIQLTAEEETIRDAEEVQAEIRKQNIIDKQTLADEKLASGKQKLKDLGLNDDEIKALTGA